MKNLILTAALATFVAGPALAQQTPMEIAQSQNACGTDGTIVSARYLDDGRVGVQCSEAVAGASCVPATFTPADESERRALEIARDQNTCGDRAILAADFGTNNEVRVQCAAAGAAGNCPGGISTPVVAVGLAALVLGAVAVGSGGSSSTSDTR